MDEPPTNSPASWRRHLRIGRVGYGALVIGGLVFGVALSFDDGPTDSGVAAILPVLQQHDAKATFFLIGALMERYPDAARRLVAAGHEIGNHSYTHRRMILRSADFYDREIERTDAIIRPLAALPVCFDHPLARNSSACRLPSGGMGGAW